MTRADGRAPDEMRPVSMELDFITSATGSVLFEIGSTRLICTAMVEESVPPWMRGRGTGWVTSEYGMLPGSTGERKQRDATRGKQDGGTRCAAICGGYVAIASAFRRLVGSGSLPRTPLTDAVAAISVGIVDGEVLLDLPYAEDSRAEVDMNVVMTGSGELIEVQATAEKSPFGRASLDRMLELAAGGIGEIVREQERVLTGPA